MKQLFNYTLSLPISIWTCFKLLPFKQAIRLPICVKYGSKINVSNGNVILGGKVHTAMIRIGFHKVPVCNSRDKTQIIIESGQLLFQGTAHLGQGTKIYVSKGAELILGDNFAISASSQINCYHKIRMGNDIQFSWDCLVMDSDTHTIYTINGEVANPDREILIDDNVWIGCRTTILKGSHIPEGCIVGACSLVTGNNFKRYTILIGMPAKSTKEIGKWEL